jgi:hypothetical protein
MKRLVPIFHGWVSAEGKLELAEAEQALRRSHLHELAGKNVEVIVRKTRTKRSLDQNAYWHAVPFPLLQEATGYDSIEELKFWLMGEFTGWKKTKDGRQVPMIMHTSELSTDEGALFTDWLVRLGAQMPSPCLIPLPHEAAA